MDPAEFKMKVVPTRRFLLVCARDSIEAVRLDLGPEWSVCGYGDFPSGRAFDRVYVAQEPVTQSEIDWFQTMLLGAQKDPSLAPVLL